MDNFMLEMNAHYMPSSNSLLLNPAQSGLAEKPMVTVSVSLTRNIHDRTGKTIFFANQFYTMLLIGEDSFKLLSSSGSHVTTLKDIPQDVAAKMGLSIASIKRLTNLPRTSIKTGKTEDFPSIIIPWMPGKMDQFAVRQQLGCGTFGTGSIVTMKLDPSRRRLWLINGVSGSGNVQGIPSKDDNFSRMFDIDFTVLRPFVAFSSKFQNAQLMPELPPIITDIYKKFLALETRLSELTSEFSEVGGSNSLIVFGFSSQFLDIDSEHNINLEKSQKKLMKSFEAYHGISEEYSYLNFKLFNLFVKSTGKVEQVLVVFNLNL
jgi:hypothetical protein